MVMDAKNVSNLNNTQLVCRYCVFYMPFDVGTTIARYTPVKVALCLMKEVHRTHKVFHGVGQAYKLHPDAWIVIIICGALKGIARYLRLFFANFARSVRAGAGSGIMRTFEQLVRGVWVPQSNELLRPSLYVHAYIACTC